jgi:hypothetical protein
MMKPKILFVYFGNTEIDIDVSSEQLNHDDQIHYLIDKDSLPQIKTGLRETFSVIDVSDGNQVQELLYTLMPVGHIVICPMPDKLVTGEAPEKELANLLRKLFLITKMFYVPVMRFKDSKIWYLDLSPLILTKNPAEDIILTSFSTGIETVSKVAGMELARKKILSNSIKVTNRDYLSGLMPFLRWALDKRLNLTAQELTF